MAITLFGKPPRKHVVELVSGDHLSQRKFHRLYSQSTIKKAELIDGVVYVASPVRADAHGDQDNKLAGWLML